MILRFSSMSLFPSRNGRDQAFVKGWRRGWRGRRGRSRRRRESVSCPMPIVTMRARLTDSDIRTLIKGPTETDRAQAAHKICRCIEEAELSPEERAHAEKIMGIMAEDAAVLVRRALSVAL